MTLQRNIGPEVDRGLKLYRSMLTIRLFEEAAIQARLDGEMRGSMHPYIGEEAIAVGVCSALRSDDFIASYHRGHGHCIAKGADPARMMMELFGRKGGICGGKGGSMHVADFSLGILGANGVIGDGVTISVGAAQGIKMQGRDSIVVAFFGDGGLNRGPILESMNWAKVYNLSVLFVCEDNMYAATTRTKSVTAGPGPAARAAGFGLHAETLDGNDVFGVARVTADLVSRMRSGGGPALIHALTYRHKGHLATDPATYRAQEEVVSQLQRDPIPRCEAWLRHHGVDDAVLESERIEVRQVIADALAAARSSPFPTVEDLIADVQDVGAPTWPA